MYSVQPNVLDLLVGASDLEVFILVGNAHRCSRFRCTSLPLHTFAHIVGSCRHCTPPPSKRPRADDVPPVLGMFQVLPQILRLTHFRCQCVRPLFPN